MASARPSRPPSGVEFTRIFMYVMATLVGGALLLSSCLNLVLRTDTPNAEAQQGPLALTFLILGVVFTSAHVAAARGIERREAWGRNLGIGVSGVSLLGIAYLVLIGLPCAIILLPGYVAVLWIPLGRGDLFDRPPPTSVPPPPS